MTPATILKHDGISQSITEWALDYGITPGIIIARLERGTPIADAITTPMKVGHHCQRLPVFSSMQKKNRAVAASPRAPRKRLARPDGKPHNAKLIEHDGISLTVREWSARTGVPMGRIYDRLHRGWTFADAIAARDMRTSKQTSPKPDTKHIVSPRTVESRVRRGWPLELAMTEPPGARMGRYARRGPGVVSDFEPFEGTGAGSTAQETPNLSF